jgi:thermitase
MPTNSEKVKVQVAKLLDETGGRAFRRQLLEKVQQRPANQRVPRNFSFGALEQPDAFLVGVSGQIMVAQASVGDAGQLLAPVQAEPVPELNGRVHRFRVAQADVRQLDTEVGRLKAAGIEASLNYIVPLGYVAKGEGGFEPSDTKPQGAAPPKSSSTAARVAVIDTGISSTNRTDKWLNSISRRADNIDSLYIPNSNPRLLDYAAGHGEFVAGIVQQLCPQADIRVYKALQSDGIGDEVRVAATILRAASEGAELINLSLGTATVDDKPPVTLQAAIALLTQRHPNVLVVASAGNSPSKRPVWPAAFDSVVAVGALSANGKRAPWSNHGDWVDCFAVGEGIVSTYVEGTESPDVDKDQPDTFGRDAWALGTGTSYATPQITGKVAQALTANRAKQWTPRRALQEVLGNAPGGAIRTALPGTVPAP